VPMIRIPDRGEVITEISAAHLLRALGAINVTDFTDVVIYM